MTDGHDVYPVAAHVLGRRGHRPRERLIGAGIGRCLFQRCEQRPALGVGPVQRLDHRRNRPTLRRRVGQLDEQALDGAEALGEPGSIQFRVGGLQHPDRPVKGRLAAGRREHLRG